VKYPTKKFIVIALPLLGVIGLSACSSIKPKTNTLQRLQYEADHHQYSSYVKNNLSPQAAISSAHVKKYPVNTGNISRFLAVEKKRMTQHKKRSHGSIRSVVGRNGLYTPSSASWQKSATKNSLKQTAPLSAVLSIALRNNLDIKSSQQTALASLSKYDQVSALDDMLVQYSAFTKDINLTGSTQKHNKSVSSGFPFPGLTALKASIIDQSVESSRLQLKQTVQDVITQVRIAYYELQYAQQESSLTLQNNKLLQSLKEELENAYASNTSSLNEILQIDIEIEENRNSNRIAKNKQQAQQARLNALLNLDSTFKLGRLDALKPVRMTRNAQQLLIIAKNKRVEIARLRSNLKKMKRIIQLSEKRFYPDFDAGYSRFQNRTSQQVGSNANRDAFSKRPKIKSNGFFAKNDAYLTETKLKYKALQAKINALNTKTADDIQQALSSYQTQKNHYTLYQSKILPKAKESLELAKNDFEAGEGGLANIISSQQMVLNYRLLVFKATAGMNVNVAKLKRIVGES